MIVSGEDFWRWQTMNPDGYAHDESFEVSVLDEPVPKKTVSLEPVKIPSTSNGITSVNGTNGIDDH